MHISWPATCTASRRSCFFTVAADAAAEFPASQASARAPAHRDSDRRADGSVAVRTPRKEEADTIFFAEEENEKRDFPDITKRSYKATPGKAMSGNHQQQRRQQQQQDEQDLQQLKQLIPGLGSANVSQV